MRAKLALAGTAALSLAATAIAQDRDAPESLLPPGFSQPAPAPAPTPASTAVAPGSAATVAPRPVATGELPPLAPLTLPSGVPTPIGTPSPGGPVGLAVYQMPDWARRSIERVGVGGANTDIMRPGMFGDADGRYLEVLMRRLSAPLPSRWLSITLRRALVAQADTPAGLNGADFAAERAWLLLRMGEAASARAVVQGVDDENVTPKLRQVWMQAALANADPAGLCSLADSANNRTAERGWLVAYAMCQGLSGTGNPQALLSDIRRRRVATGVDLRLAQKVIGAGAQSRQAVTIEWNDVSQLTTWRWGLATATGVTVPDELYETVGPQLYGWRALAPAILPGDRLAAADVAAGMGVLSSAALVDLYGAAGGADDASPAATEAADLLRQAYVGEDRATRVNAMKRLWDGGTGTARYGRLVLTARAAARLAVYSGLDDADRLVASMLAAGLDRSALRWRGQVGRDGDAWAMLTLADPDATGAVGFGTVSGYSPSHGNAMRKRQLFFAGLAGLGRLSPSDIEQGAESLDIRIGAQTAWTRAIDAAAQANQPGTVVLLAAIGMQTESWAGVPPAALYRIVGALRSVGLEGEARMIAAEAIARL